MKALYKEVMGQGIEGTKLVDIPVPELNDVDNVLIKVKACAVCGQDNHIDLGKLPWFKAPGTFGHEFVGIIEEIKGDGNGLKVGDRVISAPHLYACGECDVCKAGLRQFCKSKRTIGQQRDGAFAEYVAVPAEYLHRVPDDMTDELACICEPFTISVTDLVIRGGLQPGESLLIVGSGQVGLLALIAAVSQGANPIFVSGVSQDVAARLPLAKELGATYIFNSEEEDVVARVKELTGGKGVDVALDASGNAAGINTGLEALRFGGRMVAMGATKKDTVPINWDAPLKKACTIYYNMFAAYEYETMETAIELMHKFPNDASKLITHRFKLDEYREMFNKLREEAGIKGVFFME